MTDAVRSRPCSCTTRPEGHGSRLVVWIEADERIMAVKRRISVSRRRCPECGSTWSDDMPGRAGLRVDDLLFERALGLSTEFPSSQVSSMTGLSTHLVARIVEANIRYDIAYQRLVPPFVVRRIASSWRIVDASGEPVPGAMALASGVRKATSFASALGGPFLCDLPSLAFLGRIVPGAEAFLHPAAASSEAASILLRIPVRSAPSDDARSNALHKACGSISRRIVNALDAPTTPETLKTAKTIVASLEGEMRRLCVPVAHVLRALPPARNDLMEAAHPANWVLCSEFRPAPGQVVVDRAALPVDISLRLRTGSRDANASTIPIERFCVR
jgi:hypothetical protein